MLKQIIQLECDRCHATGECQPSSYGLNDAIQKSDGWVRLSGDIKLLCPDCASGYRMMKSMLADAMDHYLSPVPNEKS